MLPIWTPNLIVFLSNVCIMTLEIVAGRMLAPLLGVSLYTWTSVIGVVLAGLSLGNYLGGKLADRHPSRTTLGLQLLVGAAAALSVLSLLNLASDVSFPEGTPLILRVVGVTTLVFFLPSCLLGTVSPVVIKLTLHDLGTTGSVAGNIYASAALGSIVGTFATGFYLIAWFGTRTIILLVAGLLTLLALAYGDWRARRRWSLVLLAGLLLAGLMMVRSGLAASPCTLETSYFCIKVRLAEPGDPTRKALVLDRLIHSYVDVDDPTYLGYGYEQAYARATEAWTRDRPVRSAFFIGGGGYVFPRYLLYAHPGTRAVVAEIDAGVTAVARARLGLEDDRRLEIHHRDARSYLEELPAGVRFDVIYGDAFNDYSVPYHLTTHEFNRLVKRHLRPGGAYMVNLVDGSQALFARSYVHTLRASFPYVWVVPPEVGPETKGPRTFVVLASERPFLQGADWLWQGEALATWLEGGRQVFLRDDYVPADNLLAPVHAESD